ncbi:sensor histidine kinase [Massilia endophytica]|uniref:sensor histidine kinase n=1 Tax=Massilia endophytica TaxID=2899220 RepID=UPI001E43E964|nr:sensor histidine kinase [Massilia endophytica]UGQ46670.1 ATP-binding protein [Massilia endophytica]
MYSLLPAVVSALFISYGAYVLHSRGANRVSVTFFLLCITTFLWQAAWAVLFQTEDADIAWRIVQAGYVPILFLPTALYHFITELTRRHGDRRLVYASYGLSAVLAVLLLGTDWVVAGLYPYFFGYYPMAGVLHPLYLAQTVAVVGRAVALLYLRQEVAVSTERTRLRYCLFSILIYFAAAVDYLCNYGVEFYPPGVLCIACSLGLIAQAMVRHNLLADPMAAAATIAHEVRTPLATIRSQSRVLARSLPELIAGYQRSEAPGLAPEQLRYLSEIATHIEAEVARSNFIVDMLLASARAGTLQCDDFALHSVRKCIEEAIACYPFAEAERERVALLLREDFSFYGSDTLLVYVLYNLLKNALHAVKAAGRGGVTVECFREGEQNWLVVADTGQGIPPDVLPHVFDPYYSTRHSSGGTGMGLAFCKKVVNAFGGSIRVESEPGLFTRLSLSFPGERKPRPRAREIYLSPRAAIVQAK